MTELGTKEVHWTEVFGNPYLTSLDSRMLADEGYQVMKETKLKGHSKLMNYNCIITYDKEYVIEYLKKKVVIPLRFSEWDDLQYLLAVVWNDYRNEKKK